MNMDSTVPPITPLRSTDGPTEAPEETSINALGPTSADRWEDQDGEPILRIPILEEELVVERRPVRLGSLHLHQRVETREARIPVPLVRESISVEHIPAAAYDPTGPKDPEVVAIIPIMEEQLVVTKRQVVTEYVLIRKTQHTETQEVRDMVRRTVVDIEDQSGDAAHSAQ